MIYKTNITAINRTEEEVQTDLDNLKTWLDANKLILNIQKTVHMKISKRASNDDKCFKFNNQDIHQTQCCKYLGMFVDADLSFKSHIEYVRKRLGKQCGKICKLRHYVPRAQLINYYRSNIEPIIQYGVLVYGCANMRNLMPILISQKKILKFIHFRCRCDDIFLKNNLLIVFELHIYELLKFVLKSVKRMHSHGYLNEMYRFKEGGRETRLSEVGLLYMPSCKRKQQRSSINYRAAKLFNILKSCVAIPPDITCLPFSKISSIYHSLKTTIPKQNQELVDAIYK